MKQQTLSNLKVTGGALAAIAAGTLALTTDKVRDFIGQWEGQNQYVVYADKLAGGLPTVCKGITRYSSPYPVVVGEVWTPEKCEEVEKYSLENYQMLLAKCINVPVTQNMFDAFSSHAWNFGVSATCGSGFMKEVNSLNYVEGCNRISYHADGSPAWSNAGGKFVQGLHNRRKAETQLCLTGIDAVLDPIPLGDSPAETCSVEAP